MTELTHHVKSAIALKDKPTIPNIRWHLWRKVPTITRPLNA